MVASDVLFSVRRGRSRGPGATQKATSRASERPWSTALSLRVRSGLLLSPALRLQSRPEGDLFLVVRFSFVGLGGGFLSERFENGIYLWKIIVGCGVSVPPYGIDSIGEILGRFARAATELLEHFGLDSRREEYFACFHGVVSVGKLVAAVRASITAAAGGAAEADATLLSVSPAGLLGEAAASVGSWGGWASARNNGFCLVGLVGRDHPAFLIWIPAGSESLQRVFNRVGVACDGDEVGSVHFSVFRSDVPGFPRRESKGFPCRREDSRMIFFVCPQKKMTDRKFLSENAGEHATQPAYDGPNSKTN
jgi:hypothetical protein